MAKCSIVNIEPGKAYDFNCDGNFISEKCGSIKGVCEFKLNEKLKIFNAKLANSKIEDLETFNRVNSVEINCTPKESSLLCQKKNNCSGETDNQIDKLFKYIDKSISEKSSDVNCEAFVSPISNNDLNVMNQLICKNRLIAEGIDNIEEKIASQCPRVQVTANNKLNCKFERLLRMLDGKVIEGNIEDLLQGETCNGALEIESKKKALELNKEFKQFLSSYFKGNLEDCQFVEINKKNVEQLICFKVEEFKFNQKIIHKNNCSKNFGMAISNNEIKLADKEKPIDPRNIAGQPEKESFTLPTEAPVIKNQEALQKIDKLIADNGGEMTPEVAKKAGEIFNSEIYQPTKNFLNSVNQAITGASNTSGSSGASGRTSANSRPSNSKSYEIGSKGARGVANITEEAPSAVRATALNGKMASGGSNMLSADAENPANAASANREASTGNTQNDKKLEVNNFAGGQGFSGVGGPSGSGSSAGVGSAGFSSGGSADRNQELQQLPSLSSEEKSEITKVVQALKGAESPEDVKSIVTGEDNYKQVKRMVQELEQSKKGVTSNSAVANGRNPASAQASLEVKEFEKTLEKFGIKVYGEAGPGKAVYAPTTVNHVIVLKSNSVHFLNTIRSKK